MDALSKPRVVAVGGPTATGKTALSVALAKEFGGEIINADSMQVYKNLNVGTAKPTAEERQGIPHHLLDFLTPETPYSVADFTAAAAPLITQINAQNRLPLVVGGTGLYISSLLKGVAFETQNTAPALREQLRPYVGDVVTFIHEALAQNKTILLEGQLGSMKDPDLGIFPMTTSSHTLAGFGCVGAPVPPTAMEDVICVTKAYSSSVGSHTEPFVSEVLGDAGDELRRMREMYAVAPRQGLDPELAESMALCAVADAMYEFAQEDEARGIAKVSVGSVSETYTAPPELCSRTLADRAAHFRHEAGYYLRIGRWLPHE